MIVVNQYIKVLSHLGGLMPMAHCGNGGGLFQECQQLLQHVSGVPVFLLQCVLDMPKAFVGLLVLLDADVNRLKNESKDSIFEVRHLIDLAHGELAWCLQPG